ncbi:nuclear transport factor 2 family protein [Bradyrhizobium sp. CB2312]|uniref:YybH family protein n=1 Tax=Bradyrhizobium sp. CB2312 TaxID=3039155 RepID=UPI0024B10644|nr:nuclear transport factor 2 family protein [Bradyrhizobium sp. CB2312]WFU74843.1 nuclear transport factor 2 family protein [Bradyrhizobium sp. CB2312]
MSFDPMAAAVDWFDAYRAGDIEAIVDMYAEDAVVFCDCDGLAITGREALRSYWAARLKNTPLPSWTIFSPRPAGH